MIWVLFGFISSICAAALPEVNRKYKLSSDRLNFWRSLFSTLIMVPFIPFMNWPQHSIFYFAVACYATLVILGMNIIMNMAAKHNGRVASMFMPVKVFAAFIIWILIEEGAWTDFVSNPVAAGIIALSFMIMLLAMQSLRRNDTGWRAFLAVAPVGVMYAIVDIASRLGIEGHDLIPTTLTFMFLSYALSTFLTAALLISRLKDNEKFVTKRFVVAGSMVGVVHIVLLFSATLCIMLTPNPAYFSIIQMLVPVLLMAYHKMIGVEDDASPKVGLIMVFAAIIMIWATTL